MTGKIRLATSPQILALAVAWLGACMGLDYTFNRHLWAGTTEALPSNVPLSLRINHLCCTGCLSDVRAALEQLPWLKDAPMKVREGNLRTQEQADVAGPVGDYGGWLDIDVPSANLNQIDFVAIDHALRAAGLVASEMRFGGVRHFRLEATVHHLCCGMCVDASERMGELAKVKAAGRLRWLDSVTGERSTGKVTVHARYLEPGDQIDASELLGAMEELGLPPFSLKVVVAPEEQ